MKLHETSQKNPSNSKLSFPPLQKPKPRSTGDFPFKRSDAARKPGWREKILGQQNVSRPSLDGTFWHHLGSTNTSDQGADLPGTPKDMGGSPYGNGKLPILFSYQSHIFRDSYGILWEWFGNGMIRH